jgi:hypothetical protein
MRVKICFVQVCDKDGHFHEGIGRNTCSPMMMTRKSQNCKTFFFDKNTTFPPLVCRENSSQRLCHKAVSSNNVQLSTRRIYINDVRSWHFTYRCVIKMIVRIRSYRKVDDNGITLSLLLINAIKNENESKQVFN